MYELTMNQLGDFAPLSVPDIVSRPGNLPWCFSETYPCLDLGFGYLRYAYTPSIPSMLVLKFKMQCGVHL